MGKLELVRALYDYNEWANIHLLKTASTLTPQQLSSPAGASWGSIETNLGHIVGAQLNWLSRWLTGANLQSTTDIQEITGIDKLQATFEKSHAELRDFIAGLSSERLEQVVAYRDSRGNAFEHVLWQLMVHVANHGTYHRGEIAMALTALDRSPGDLDYLYFEFARGGPR